MSKGRELELKLEQYTKELADVRAEKAQQLQRIEILQLEQHNDQLEQKAPTAAAGNVELKTPDLVAHQQQLHTLNLNLEKSQEQCKRLEKTVAMLTAVREEITADKPSSKTGSAPLPPTKACINRIQQDLKHLYRTPVDGIFVVPDEDKVNVCHAIVLGPTDTPYEWGFFYFLLEFPYDYPHNPPKVTLQTTGGGGVRFNPNFYQNGKVCLSILGTWSGPSWSPVHTIESVLLSIRSLMNEHPYHNEPGYEGCEKKVGASKNYNQYVRHETLRVAVLGMTEQAVHSCLPNALCDTIREIFLGSIEIYRYMCEEYMFLDGRYFNDPFSSSKGSYSFSKMKDRIDVVEQACRKETTNKNR